MCLAFERRGRLRVTEAEEIAGLDVTMWDTANEGHELLDAAAEGVASGRSNGGMAAGQSLVTDRS